MKALSSLVKKIANSFGYDIRRCKDGNLTFPVELSSEEKNLVNQIIDRRLSMSSYERLFNTVLACKYVRSAGISGDFVECGVWRGGNSILASKIFMQDLEPRNIILFDTFSGMTKPTDSDVSSHTNESAIEKYLVKESSNKENWCAASDEEVLGNFKSFGVNSKIIKIVKGDVSKTLEIKENLPEKISVLRLDTDWYESTKKELELLYPRLVSGGVLIVDDYGHWAGSKRAIDDYFSSTGNRPFLQYVDYTARCAVKP